MTLRVGSRAETGLARVPPGLFHRLEGIVGHDVGGLDSGGVGAGGLVVDR